MEKFKPASLAKKLPSHKKYTLDHHYYPNDTEPQNEFYQPQKPCSLQKTSCGITINNFIKKEEVNDDSDLISFVSSSSSEPENLPYYIRPDGFVVFAKKEPLILFLNKDLYKEYIIQQTDHSITFLKDHGLILDFIFYAKETLDNLPEWSSKRQRIINTIGFLFDILDFDDLINPNSTFGSTENYLLDIFDFVQDNRQTNQHTQNEGQNNSYFVA